jgi:hypothetical protein
MSVTLSIASSDLDPEGLNNLTQDLCRTLNSETDLSVSPVEHPEVGAGNKGDIVTVGSIALGLISSGGVVVTLINVLKSYFERGRPIEIELERPDGKKLKLKSENVQQEQIDQTMTLAREFFGVSE